MHAYGLTEKVKLKLWSSDMRISLVYRHQRFGETCYVHLQGRQAFGSSGELPNAWYRARTTACVFEMLLSLKNVSTCT